MEFIWILFGFLLNDGGNLHPPDPAFPAFIGTAIAFVIADNIAIFGLAHSFAGGRYVGWQVFVVSQFVAALIAGIIWFFFDWPWAVFVFAVSLIVYLLVIWLWRQGEKAREEDQGLATWSQTIFWSSEAIDIQINHIFGHVVAKGDADVVNAEVREALEYVLNRMAASLDLGPGHDSHLSIVQAANGRFKVLATQGVSVIREGRIPSEFGYPPQQTRGVAGLAAMRMEIVCISDLSDPGNPDTDYWERLDSSEQKQGSLICVPIISKLPESGEQELFGVLSITSIKEGTFDSETDQDLIGAFAEKAETLIYALRLVNL
jgi:hypothetical protein